MQGLRKHMHNVAVLSRELGKMYGLNNKDLKLLEVAAEYHDVGKKVIKNKFLFEKKSLNKNEFEVIKKHAYLGAVLLKNYGFEQKITDAVLYHHEWWNGKGYPEGLKGMEIPLFARIISIADAYDAMTSRRSYRKAVSPIKAINEILKCSGTQFDPELASLFIRIRREDDALCLKQG